MQTENPGSAFDIRAVLEALALPFIFWTAAVALVTWFGYPGVVCMTPLAWLLAIPAGQRVARTTHTQIPGRVILEAATGGVILGIYEGLLFMAVNMFEIAIQPEERAPVQLFSWIVIVAGAVICAGISAFSAAYLARKKGTA